jgi:hypothetical protein
MTRAEAVDTLLELAGDARAAKDVLTELQTRIKGNKAFGDLIPRLQRDVLGYEDTFLRPLRQQAEGYRKNRVLRKAKPLEAKIDRYEKAFQVLRDSTRSEGRSEERAGEEATLEGEKRYILQQLLRPDFNEAAAEALFKAQNGDPKVRELKEELLAEVFKGLMANLRGYYKTWSRGPDWLFMGDDQDLYQALEQNGYLDKDSQGIHASDSFQRLAQNLHDWLKGSLPSPLESGPAASAGLPLAAGPDYAAFARSLDVLVKHLSKLLDDGLIPEIRDPVFSKALPSKREIRWIDLLILTNKTFVGTLIRNANKLAALGIISVTNWSQRSVGTVVSVCVEMAPELHGPVVQPVPYMLPFDPRSICPPVLFENPP